MIVTKEEHIVYHGSAQVVDSPSLDKARPHNDYGPGFYCTKIWELAAEWACKQGADGFVNSYKLDLPSCKVLNLMDGSFTVLHWIALLMANRQFVPRNAAAHQIREQLLERFLPSTAGFDVIIGYRADDSYFSYAEDFIENSLPVQNLATALSLGKLGLQTVLVSSHAFECLSFMGAEAVLARDFHGRFLARDQKARQTYAGEIQNSIDFSTALFAADILREKVTFDDERIPRLLPQ